LCATLTALAAGCEGCEGCEGTRVVEDAGVVLGDVGVVEDGATQSGGPSEAGAILEPPLDPAREAGPSAGPACPREMVLIGGGYCVDRYEAALVDDVSGRPLSPYYRIERQWQTKRLEMGDPDARALGLPALADWQRMGELRPRAVSARSTVPQGYVSGQVAELACRNAGKRLCTLDEWRIACRGQRGKRFPYGDGDKYLPGKCNVFRESHPAMVLHGDFSIGHTDPRLNIVKVKKQPLLRETGATSECVSEWGDDGIADMVGNLDEWVQDPGGTFVGGFYARATKEGCEATISTHSIDYFDYSTGIRCCGEPKPPAGGSL
jgi:hypothetical protein